MCLSDKCDENHMTSFRSIKTTPYPLFTQKLCFGPYCRSSFIIQNNACLEFESKICINNTNYLKANPSPIDLTKGKLKPCITH